MPFVSQLFFKTAVVFFIAGVIMGLQMAITGSHDVIAAHAHVNLLGWVSMAIFGGYYALNPAKAGARLAIVHYGVYTLGVAVMGPALYLMLSGNPALEPLVAVSSLVTFAGVLLFGYTVFAKDQRSTIGSARAPASA